MGIENLIWLNGMPRSGTSWLSQIFDSHPTVSFKLSPLFSYAFKNKVNETSSRALWIQFFTDVFSSKDEFINQIQRRNSGEYPIFEKESLTNLVIKDTRYHHLTDCLLHLFDDIKFIHIIRHPCGVINSWINAPREFQQHLNPLEEWREAKSRKTGIEEFWGFNDWLLLTKKYLELQKTYPNNVKVVYYEKLVMHPLDETINMFDFANLKMNSQTIQFIHESQNSHQEGEYAVYKNKKVATEWKSQLDLAIVQEIENELIKNNLDTLFNT